MSRAQSCLVLVLVFVLAAAFVMAAHAQPPGAQGSYARTRGGSFLGMLRVEKIQQELKLSEEQIGKVREIGEKLWEEMGQKYAGVRDIEDRQKQLARMVELRDEFDQKAHGQIREILAQEQMIRLYQIRLQVRGAVHGLNNRFVAGRLNLTDEQKEKAAKIEKATQEKSFEAYSGLRGLGQEERREKYAEIREKVGKIRSQAEKKALKLLTAEQKEALEQIKGEKLEL